MATAQRTAGEQEVASAAGASLARSAAIVVLVVTGLAALRHLIGLVTAPPDPTAWTAMPIGTAVLLASTAGVALAVSNGWNARARRLSVLVLVLPVSAATLNHLLELGLLGGGAAVRSGLASLVPLEQTSRVQIALGLALFATPRAGRLLTATRSIGLLGGVLVPAMSLSNYAYGVGGYSLLPGVTPMTGIVAATTIVLAFAVAGTGPARWPVRTLVQGPTDRVLVGRMLPFIVAMPVVGPILLATARLAGAGSEVTIAIGVLGPSLVLVAVLAVALRDHRAQAEELASRDRHLLITLDALPQAVFLRDEQGELLHLNPAGARLLERLGLDRHAVSSGPDDLSRTTLVVDEHGRSLSPRELPTAQVIADGVAHTATLGFIDAATRPAWFSVEAAPVPLSDGSTGIVVTYADVTDAQEARARLLATQRTLRLTFDHAPIGIAVVAPTGELLEVNDALADLLGRGEQDLLSRGLDELTHPDDRDEDERLVTACLSGALDRYRVERRYAHADGRWIWTQLSVALVRGEDGAPRHFIAQLADLSERRDLEQELRAAAMSDPLTGLVNRRALADQLEQARCRRAREGGEIGLLYLDLDRFKAINDGYGHDVGDRVLIEVARRLTTTTREVDTVCRIGGDEFIVLCSPIDGLIGLTELVSRLERMPPVAVLVGGRSVEVGMSYGTTLVDGDEDLDTALRRADAAMYRAKRGGDTDRRILSASAASLG